MTSVLSEPCTFAEALDVAQEEVDVVLVAVKQNKEAIKFAPYFMARDYPEIRDIINRGTEINSEEMKHGKQILSSKRNDVSSSSVVMKPPPFNETIFTLKASATQLIIRVIVLTLTLLPFFDKGFAW
jgi:tRNA isopentenyl-2-thiomethyl-A-37 hydroxylase MiaE